jgi:CHAT domain-containing protein
MGFPFEMLPVDDSGTRRIGTEVPISRHLLGQGRSIERAPLALPLQGDRGLKILSILAEIPKSWLDRYGFVRDGQPDEADAPVLNSISLKDEASELYRSFNNFSANIEEITFLSSRPVQGPAIKWALPTAAALKTALREQQFDLIHFAGHVIFSSDSSIKQGVILQDEMVTLGALSKLLEEQKNLRFAYLSGCESGRMITNTFSSNLLGVAQTCIEAGVPAILSMRWPIPSGVSRRLTEEFYPAFFESGSLEQAALKAIKSLHDDQAVFSAAPILLMH